MTSMGGYATSPNDNQDPEFHQYDESNDRKRANPFPEPTPNYSNQRPHNGGAWHGRLDKTDGERSSKRFRKITDEEELQPEPLRVEPEARWQQQVGFHVSSSPVRSSRTTQDCALAPYSPDEAEQDEDDDDEPEEQHQSMPYDSLYHPYQADSPGWVPSNPAPNPSPQEQPWQYGYPQQQSGGSYQQQHDPSYYPPNNYSMSYRVPPPVPFPAPYVPIQPIYASIPVSTHPQPGITTTMLCSDQILAPPPPAFQIPFGPPPPIYPTCIFPPFLLYSREDDEILSDYQILLRQQIELFQADALEVNTVTPGRKKSIALGQAGIRCRYCATQPAERRTAATVYFPSKLMGLYQAAQNIGTCHLTQGCPNIPPHILRELHNFHTPGRHRTTPGNGGKQFWADSASSRGIYEAPDGLRFSFLRRE